MLPTYWSPDDSHSYQLAVLNGADAKAMTLNTRMMPMLSGNEGIRFFEFNMHEL